MGQARARSSKMGSSVSPAILAREFVQQFRQCRGALIALLGRDAGGLSASTIGRLKEAWSEEHSRWSKRDLSAKRYIYFWVDGIHVQARLEDTAQCLLIIIGATPEGRKELVGLTDGVRESAQSWRELLAIPSGNRGNVGAQTRRFNSEPSSAMSNAVSAPPKVSATISVRPSGVMTEPFGKCMPVAATLTTMPSGSTRARRAVGWSAKTALGPRLAISASRSKPKSPT